MCVDYIMGSYYTDNYVRRLYYEFIDSDTLHSTLVTVIHYADNYVHRLYCGFIHSDTLVITLITMIHYTDIYMHRLYYGFINTIIGIHYTDNYVRRFSEQWRSVSTDTCLRDMTRRKCCHRRWCQLIRKSESWPIWPAASQTAHQVSDTW